jgi:hypothetical protein
MDQKTMKIAMLQMGKMHQGLCSIPLVGEWLARGFSHLFALFPVLGPSAMGRTTCIEDTLKMMRASGEEFGFPFEFSAINGDEFTLKLPHCPYGFCSAADQKPCDTAMDMDRFMLKLCGAKLTVQETIPQGAQRCKMVIRQIRKAKT